MEKENTKIIIMIVLLGIALIVVVYSLIWYCVTFPDMIFNDWVYELPLIGKIMLLVVIAILICTSWLYWLCHNLKVIE